MAKAKQLLLLIWKNFKLQLRHPWITLLELGLPALFALSLVFLRTQITSEDVTENTIYESFSINSLPSNITSSNIKRWNVLYMPDSTTYASVMDRVASKLNIIPKGFDDENSLLEYYANSSESVLAGVVFDVQTKDGEGERISYTIRPRAPEGANTFKTNAYRDGLTRWYTELSFPLFAALGPRNRFSTWGGTPGYMSKGFLPLQHAIAMSLMEVNMSLPSELKTIDVQMQRYPYPPFIDDKFIITLQWFLPVILCFSFTYPAVNLVKNIVVEKEKKLKEAMKMMGLSSWLHWMAWFIKYKLLLCVSCIIMTVMLCVHVKQGLAVVNYSHWSLILLWLLLYTISLICFSFFISTLFSKANTATFGTYVIFYLSFVLYIFILMNYQRLTHLEKLAFCLIPNTAVAMGAIVLQIAESSGIGLQWQNIARPAILDDTLALSDIFFMLILNSIIFIMLAWYIEAVFPGEYGVPEKWYFPFTYSYWCGSQPVYDDMVQLFDTSISRSDFFEEDPDRLLPGVQIQNLTKVYAKRKEPAVNSINLNMYRGQITALLGHNGAGKTTTISMLTGLYPPTSGTAIVNGYDICDEMNAVHSSLGICPQYDVLFDDLTVQEHLYFFCKLKGYMSDLVKSEIDHILTSLQIEDKRDSLAKTLSGGMKRKLSVGIALAGGSRVVILDEPTSGLDPFNRRKIWDILQSEKEDRTILLTTHFMQEADVLGDRIAIMSDGELQCCGSPLFLKKKYGVGYHLVMVKAPDCNVDAVTHLICSHVPNAELASNIGTELKYILPHESSQFFQNLFSELEKRGDELKISSYGASITTMEEVFIKAGHKLKMTEIEVKPTKQTFSPEDSGIHSPQDEAMSDITDYRNDHQNTGASLLLQQFSALLKKNMIYSLRNKLLTSSQLFLPPLILTLTLLMLKTMPKPEDSPPLKLSLQPFGGTQIPYSFNDDSSQSLAKEYVSQFRSTDRAHFVNSSYDDVISYLIRQGRTNLKKYNYHDIIAADFKQEENNMTVTSLFNNQAYHSPAISLLAVDNAILKYITKNSSLKFAVTNYPLPRTLSTKSTQQMVQTSQAYQSGQSLIFGMSFLVASFAVFLVKERATNSKHIQKVSGINLINYWCTAFIWNLIIYLVPCILVLVVFVSFQMDGFSTATQLGRLFLLLFLYGLASIPLIYCFSFLFLCPSTAYTYLSIINMLIGVAFLVIVSVLEIPLLHLEYVSRPLDYAFSILIPNYNLGRSVSNLYQNYQFNKFCNNPLVKLLCMYSTKPNPCCKGNCDICIPWQDNYFAWEQSGIGKSLVFLALQFVVFLALLVACEMNVFRRMRYYFKGNRRKIGHIPSLEHFAAATDSIEDEDVKAERHRISNAPLQMLFPTHHLIIKELRKKYGSLVATHNLTFGVRKGECFGLLGLNGAGKTTTFKMITGEESITSGDIYLDGCNVKKEIRRIQHRIGYCPQFDALIDQFTGKETLMLYSRLRGIPENLIPDHIASLSELLSFKIHINKKVGEYSGGNKRKLSTAIALIGNSPVVFLDEPTSGMDPVSRRCMWNAFLQVIKSGRSIVLTSHSMEECEALCSRLVIMVNGKLCCLGSPQHLKNKFGQGFTLIIKVRRVASPECETNGNHDGNHWLFPNKNTTLTQDIAKVKTFVANTFASAILRSEHDILLHYHIPNPELRWSEIFGAMEEAKVSLNIEDYSVGETMLEQVFLNFAVLQRNNSIVEV